MYNCEKCGTKLTLYTQVDAYACLKCDEWDEDPCPDIDCEFCNGRTDKPSQLKEEKNGNDT